MRLCAVALSLMLTALPVPAPCAPREEVMEIVMDVDSGADDAMALLELLAAEQADDPTLTRTKVVAITCVDGNAGLRHVERNVLATLRTANRLDIPVYAGVNVSLLYKVPTVDMYGRDGFGDFLPDKLDYGEVQEEHAVLALMRLARENPGRLTLLAIAPLTNIALAQRIDPCFLSNFKEVYINGAVAHGGGNEGSPGKEINSFADPEAAFIVYNSTKSLLQVMPAETANDLRISKEWRKDVLGSVDSPQVQLLNKAERVVLEAEGEHWVNANGLLAAAILQPDILKERNPGKMLVSTDSGVARGATFVDWHGGSGPNNVRVLEKPDTDKFKELALRLLALRPEG